ncbi:hypothetical protein TIFTF001_006460 [Ficus carica]|uniref:RRM domain-containing protein n=1 Tax=Ficus carica TaxID=3494 RepID=A0AA88D0U1_FICCA|nr:hypothetical protein TIFTF001_006460 [Ficus carica]
MAHPPYDPYFLHHQQPPPIQELNDRNAINTLFVSGLPDDVKAREIHNLFRRRPGFDSCQLKYTGRGNQVVAFATFFNHQSAVASLHALNGVKFDPQSGSVLHIELARSNSRRKRKPGSGPYVVIDNRSNKEEDNAREESSDGGGDGESNEPSDSENQDSGEKDDLVTPKSGETAVESDNAIAAVNKPEKTVEGGQCSTLFIANLGPNCTEDELKQVLSDSRGGKGLGIGPIMAQSSGFDWHLRSVLFLGHDRNCLCPCTIVFIIRGGMPVAFADFEELEQASKAMEELTGTMLPSSDRGGMHIEYARSKMRKT